MAAANYLPVALRDAGGFLKREFAPFQGRTNVILRCMLTSAIVIGVPQALEVPELVLSLLVVFYVTQSNVVVTRPVGLMFIDGSTLAIGLSILLSKFTFDYPLLRIMIASVLFFCRAYLIRIFKIGVVFFIVAIVVIYVQRIHCTVAVVALDVCRTASGSAQQAQQSHQFGIEARRQRQGMQRHTYIRKRRIERCTT